MLHFYILITILCPIQGVYIPTLAVSNQQEFTGTASACRAEASRIEARLGARMGFKAVAVCNGADKQASDALYQP